MGRGPRATLNAKTHRAAQLGLPREAFGLLALWENVCDERERQTCARRGVTQASNTTCQGTAPSKEVSGGLFRNPYWDLCLNSLLASFFPCLLFLRLPAFVVSATVFLQIFFLSSLRLIQPTGVQSCFFPIEVLVSCPRLLEPLSCVCYRTRIKKEE